MLESLAGYKVHRYLSTQLDVSLKPKPEWRCQAASLSQLPRAASMVLGGQKMLGLKPLPEAEFPEVVLPGMGREG